MNKTKTFTEEEVRAALSTAERLIIDSAEEVAKKGKVSEFTTKVGIDLYMECAGVFRRTTESLLNL